MLNALANNDYEITRRGLLSLLVNQNIKVHYQCIYHPISSELIGVEALSRLHKGDSVHLPSNFIGRFISEGISTHLDMHVIKNVVKQMSLWGKYTPKVNINFSLNQFEDSRLSERLTQLAGVYKIPPSLVKIELTEGQKIHDFKSVAKQLEKLKDMGFSIAIDDFGSGYSTLKMLKEIPFIDDVKLDRFFVNNLQDEKNQKVVLEFGKFIKNLGYNFIVEGIENEFQLEFLKGTGVVDGVQGFFLHSPQLITNTSDLMALSIFSKKLA